MSGECDLFGADILVGQKNIKDDYPDISYTGEIIKSFEAALPMKSSLEPETHQLICELISNANASGELGAIEEKYLDKLEENGDAPAEETPPTQVPTSSG